MSLTIHQAFHVTIELAQRYLILMRGGLEDQLTSEAQNYNQPKAHSNAS